MNDKIRRGSLLAAAASNQVGVDDFYNPNPNYLTIVALDDDCEVSFYPEDDGIGGADIPTLQYSINGSDEWIYYESSPSIVINKDDYVSFKCDLVSGGINIGCFDISSLCNLTGNCNSILFGDDADSNFDLTGYDYCFKYMFDSCPVVEISPTFLPATTLADSCYTSMFGNCTSLTTAPELPATTLADGCYYDMFGNCTSLTTAPELPATTLASYCYSGMFSGCTSLTTAPELPATTLADYCYYYMFYGCKSLTTAPELPATTLADHCYYDMFYGCKSLTTAPELPATTLADGCYDYMFGECTSLTTAPELPATTLADGCYYDMFGNCTSLTTAPELPATTLANYCYNGMFQGCTSLTTAPELPATTLVEGCYYSMFSGCSKLNYIKAMFTTTPSSDYTRNWVYNVTSSGTFVKNKDATWNVTGTHGIPSGWTVVYAWSPQTCINLSILADNVSSGNQSTTTIHYTALCEGVDENGVVSRKTLIGDEVVEIGQNKTAQSVQKTVSFTYLNKTATTTITQGPWADASYTVNLNGQWQKSSTISNPNSSVYDGVYESYSNKGTNNSGASMYIDINGYTNFKFYIRSYAEYNFDYVMVSQLDKTLTYSSSYSDTTLVKAHTRGNQKSGTTINDYTLVEFTNIDDGSHRIQIIYRKDSSSHSGDDRGYVLIPRNQ